MLTVIDFNPPSPPLILVPPTTFLLPIPGRGVYSTSPPTAHLNNYHPTGLRSQILPCTQLISLCYLQDISTSWPEQNRILTNKVAAR